MSYLRHQDIRDEFFYRKKFPLLILEPSRPRNPVSMHVIQKSVECHIIGCPQPILCSCVPDFLNLHRHFWDMTPGERIRIVRMRELIDYQQKYSTEIALIEPASAPTNLP